MNKSCAAVFALFLVIIASLAYKLHSIQKIDAILDGDKVRTFCLTKEDIESVHIPEYKPE